MGHLAADCEGKVKRKAGEFDEKGDAEVVPKKPYQVDFILSNEKHHIFWYCCNNSVVYSTQFAVSSCLDTKRIFGIRYENPKPSI